MATGWKTQRGTAPPIFGRDEIVREARRLLDEAAQGKGQCLLLSGPVGIGKSRVLHSLADEARSRGFEVLYGRALPAELPAPFTLVRDLLRSSESKGPLEPRAASGEDALPIFLAPFAAGKAVREHADALPDTPTPVAAPLGGLLTPLFDDATEDLTTRREELFGRLVEYFVTLSHARPLLIAIDDLPFADASSLDFWERFAPKLANEPLAFVATVLPAAELPARTRDAIQTLASEPTVRLLTLRPMSVPELGEFVRFILGGQEPDPDDVLRWHAQTEGNPLFVEQLVRASLGRARPTGGPDEATAHDVTEVLVARSKALGEADRRMLTYAAILGREFEFSKLVAVAGLGEERVTESLDRLVQDGLVREKGGEVYEFATEEVRLRLYGELTETRRRLLHRKAGRGLEAAGGASDSELARQFYLGRDDAKAVEYNTRAAQSAARAFAFETAVSHVARALEAQRRRPEPDPRVELRLLSEEGRLLEELGDLRRAEEALQEAVELARSKPGLNLELGEALLGLASTRTNRAEYVAAATLATEAAQLLDKVGTPRDLMAAHRVQGTISWRIGNLADAEKHRREALAIAEVEGSALERGQALVDLANTIVPLGSDTLDNALALYTRAAALFATVEHHAAQARVLMNRAVLEYSADRFDEAFADLKLAIEAAERSRSPIWIGYCHLNLAQWNAELNRPEPARAALERAIEVVSPPVDRLAEQQIAMTRGMIAEAEGSLDAAETHYQEALAQARLLGMPVEVSEMLFRLAHLAHVRGDAPVARQRLKEALAAGLRDHRPDFLPRLAELERALGST